MHARVSRRDRVAYGLVLSLGALAVASLFQGVVDVALPLGRGEPPFAFTFALAERLGPGLLYLSILVHNVGLAALLPGLGFLAAMLEPRARLRRLIPRILLGALLASMANAFLAMFGGLGAFDLRFSLPLFLAEATAVVGVAVVTYDEFGRFEDAPPDQAAVARAFEPVAVPFFAAALGLVVLAALETRVVLGI